MNQRLFGGVLALSITVLVISNILRGDFMLAGASVVLFLAPMIAHPDRFWMATIITLGSGISFSVTGDASLHLLLMLCFIIFIIMKLAISNRQSIQTSVPRKVCIALLSLIVITAFYRGWGLRILDGTTWGGMQYVNLIAALFFYLFSYYVTITQKQLERTIRWLFVLSLIPAAGCLLVHFMPSMKWIENVVPMEKNEQQWQASEGVRWAAMQSSAIWMGILALLIYDRRTKFTFVVVLVSVLSFIMLGLSGHRAVAVLLGLIIFVYIFVKRREARLFQFLKLAGVMIILVTIIYIFVGELPRTFQRAFAWLPGINVSYEAGMDASNTSEWRIELWRQLIPMIPDYLWIGRGLAFSQIEAQSASVLASDVGTQHLYFTAVHLYHNGPLLLVLDLGLFGFALGLGFMLSGIVHYGRLSRRILGGSGWNTAYIVFYSFFVGDCIFFLTVFGAVAPLCVIFILAAILEVIVRSSEVADRNRTSEVESGTH